MSRRRNTLNRTCQLYKTKSKIKVRRFLGKENDTEMLYTATDKMKEAISRGHCVSLYLDAQD